MRKILHYLTDQEPFIHVDNWKPDPEDLVFMHAKDEFIVPISSFLGIVSQNLQLDCFSLKLKKSYKSEKAKDHFCLYLNYFEKFYDTDKELVTIYANLKCIMDGYRDQYTIDLFKQDLNKYIFFNNSLKWKVKRMNQDNYIPLQKQYKNKKKPVLEYNDSHCMLMLESSLYQIMMIPMLTHYAYLNRILNINDFLLDMYSLILYRPDISINLYNKFFETVISNTEHSTLINPLWDKQDIRGINVTTFAADQTDNIILQLMPKYEYSLAPVTLNYNSIKKAIDHQVITNEYEYNYHELDTSKKDEDSNSEFDKFESYTAKQDEGLYVQQKHTAKVTMKATEYMNEIITEEEIEFYKDILFSDTDVINAFQKKLVFNLYYSNFGDTNSIRGINRDDYIKLVICSKRKLIKNRMIVLPYVISSKMTKSVSRKSINQKELKKIVGSEIYNEIIEIYSNDEKVTQEIFSIIATIFSSTFVMIDYNDSTINGKELPPSLSMEFISKEVLEFVRMIN